MNFIGKILPVEGYYVKLNQTPPVDYAKSLTHLYQPLIGMKAIILYQTLLHEVELQTDDTLQTHHTLMNYLKISLDEIYEARIQLEGIGLLKTYKNKNEKGTFYIYHLLTPFSPRYFFQDAMLAELLYHHIGQTKYESLKRFFTVEHQQEKGQDITKSFGEVFQTFEPLFEDIETMNQLAHQSDQISTYNKIDFTWLETVLNQRMIPARKVLTKENQKLISDMMFLYDLATYEIEKSVLWALTEENILDVNEFKTACHDLFKTKHHVTPINLNIKSTPKSETESLNRPLTKEEQLIERLETISPKHLLEDLSSGSQASEQDMRIIRDVMTTQGLPSPVMNVLIHYVLLQSNMKLSKAYLEKIASHWSRAGLKTAKQAMEFARKEIVKFQQGNQTKSYYQRPKSNEVIPDWFKDRNKNAKNKSQANNQIDPKQEQEELEALMRQYAEDN